MNTKIGYTYRDGCNYKYHTEVVLKGTIPEEDMGNLAEYLFEGDGFIPEQVGLPCTRPDKFTEYDHPFCELSPDSFEETDEEPTIDMTAEEFIRKIKEINIEWNHFFQW